MTDHYKISLEILKRLLEESDNPHWANWIAKDIWLWEGSRDVKHHLGSYGGMGSINDLCVGGTGKIGIWNNQVFDTIKGLSWTLAKNRNHSAPRSSSFYRFGTGQMTGWKCRNCGHSRLNENQIEYYLAFEHLPSIIVELINEDKLESLLPISNWISSEKIENERSKVKTILSKTEIYIPESEAWLKTCSKCQSDDVCSYRWEVSNDKETVLESRNNINMKKNQHSTMGIPKKGFIAKLKGLFSSQALYCPCQDKKDQ